MAFEFPRVTSCCFCVPLRIASLLIGYFSIIMSCITLAATAFFTYKIAEYVKDNANNPKPAHPQEEVQQNANSLYISLGYYMFVFVYNFVVHLCLVIGVHTNKPNLLKFYVRTAYFLLVLAITLIILTCVFMGFLSTLPLLKWAFTLVFCIIVVRSTYLDMEEQNKPKTYEMQNLYTTHQAPLAV